MIVIANRMKHGLDVKMHFLTFFLFMPVKGQRVNCFISD